VQQTTQFSQFIAGALIHSSHNFISSYLHRSSLSVVSLMCQSTKDHADGSVHTNVRWTVRTRQFRPMIKGAAYTSKRRTALHVAGRAELVACLPCTLYHDAAGRRQSRHWSPGARLTMHLTIYRKFILSLSYDRLTINVLKFLRGMFCSLAVLDPTVGHTMDVLSPFISVILADSSTESPVHVLMLSIQAVRGLLRLRAPERPRNIVS